MLLLFFNDTLNCWKFALASVPRYTYALCLVVCGVSLFNIFQHKKHPLLTHTPYAWLLDGS